MVIKTTAALRRTLVDANDVRVGGHGTGRGADGKKKKQDGIGRRSRAEENSLEK